jgi:hypothetical protein
VVVVYGVKFDRPKLHVKDGGVSRMWVLRAVVG